MLSTILILGVAGIAKAYTIIAMKSFMFKNIDPLFFPGQYKSHMHTFMGSDAVTKDTKTSAELRAGCTTAENMNDQSVYWVPTLYYTGAGDNYTPIAPMRFSAYYENIADAEIGIPENFQLFVGNANGTTQADVDAAGAQASWFCEGEDAPADKQAAAFPTTTCSTHLQHILYFHDCVNPDDIRQKRIPQLRMSIRYDLRDIIANGWTGAPPLTLACGSSFCAHGDFINGWDAEALKNMLTADSKTEYEYVSGSLQTGVGGTPTCGAKDADPSGGTSDYLESVTMMSAKIRRAIGLKFEA